MAVEPVDVRLHPGADSEPDLLPVAPRLRDGAPDRVPGCGGGV